MIPTTNNTNWQKIEQINRRIDYKKKIPSLLKVIKVEENIKMLGRKSPRPILLKDNNPKLKK